MWRGFIQHDGNELFNVSGFDSADDCIRAIALNALHTGTPDSFFFSALAEVLEQIEDNDGTATEYNGLGADMSNPFAIRLMQH